MSFDSFTSSGLGHLDTTTSHTVYTTVWTTKVLAVSGQSTWEADYTVTEIRTGHPADYFRAAFPSSLTGPSAAGSYCTQGPEIIIISPTETEDPDASIPVETADAEEDALPAILTDFYPDVSLPSPTSSVAQDFEPELAGGGVVPPGAAPFPSGDGTELRGPGSGAEVESPTTVKSALSVLATADSDSSRSHGGTGAHVAGNINAHDDSGLTITDILPLLSNRNRTSRPSHSIVIVGLPTESSESEEDEDAISADDFDFDIDSGSASLRDDAVSSDIDVSATATATRTATSESSFTTVTILRTSSDDDTRQRSAQTSSGVEEDASTASGTALSLSGYNSTVTLVSNSTLVTITATLTSPSETTDDEDDSTTTTTTTTLRTSIFASASASAATDVDEDSNAASRVSDDDDSAEQSGAAPYIPVEAAAQRVPTQSTTLLTLNAVLVGLWVLL